MKTNHGEWPHPAGVACANEMTSFSCNGKRQPDLTVSAYLHTLITLFLKKSWQSVNNHPVYLSLRLVTSVCGCTQILKIPFSLLLGIVSHYVVLRDGQERYRGDENTFTDVGGIGPFQEFIYQLRACNKAGCTDSTKVR